jgi:Anti-sigma-K factor rskA
MIRDHSLIDELLAIQALDGLDGDDEATLDRELAAHRPCEECDRLQVEHAEVAGRLAFALDPLPVPAGMVDRILAEPQRGEAAQQDAVARDEVARDEVGRRRDARLRRWQGATGVAAAIALLLAIVLVTRGPAVPDRFVPFQGASGELAMAYTPGEPGVYVWGDGLPDPGPGKVYELWKFQGGTPIRGACLTPADGSLATFVDTDLGSSESMAVTVESEACPDAPTTEPVYTAQLS